MKENDEDTKGVSSRTDNALTKGKWTKGLIIFEKHHTVSFRFSNTNAQKKTRKLNLEKRKPQSKPGLKPDTPDG